MRIIAGRQRGRRIAAPPGRATRPMLDRVREAMFATLMPWLEDARVLDLFAGSGALGLEALSRGARAVHAVERNAATLRLLRANAAALGLEDRLELVSGDALAPQSWQGGALFAHRSLYDLVFLDPPYAMLEDGKEKGAVFAALTQLLDVHVAHEGCLVLHAPRRLLRAEEFSPTVSTGLREYGSNAVWYLTRVAEA